MASGQLQNTDIRSSVPTKLDFVVTSLLVMDVSTCTETEM